MFVNQGYKKAKIDDVFNTICTEENRMVKKE